MTMKHTFAPLALIAFCGVLLFPQGTHALGPNTNPAGESTSAPPTTQDPCVISTGEVNCAMQPPPGSSSEQIPPQQTAEPSTVGERSPSFTAIAPVPGLTDETSSSLSAFFQRLYLFIIGIAAILAVIQIIRGGVEISTESIAKHSEGRKHIGFALFGLVLVLSPVLIFSIINPKILDFSLFESLDSITSSPVSFSGAGGGAGAVPTTTSNGCRITGSANVLQVAHCSTLDSARNWAASCPQGMRASEPAAIETMSSDGVQRRTDTTFAVTCATSFDYFFLMQRGGSPDRLFSEAPATGGGVGSNNATYAKQFGNTCKQTGIPDIEVCMERKRESRQECPPSITDFSSVSGCGWYALSCRKTGYTDILSNCSNDHLWMSNPPYTPPAPQQ